MKNGKKNLIILPLKCYKKQKNNYVHKFENCKLDFTKLTKFAFFFKKICIYQKKAVPLHRN